MTIFVNSITEHIRATLADDPSLSDSGYTVDVGHPINEDQARLPWIGIWPGGLDIEGHTISGNINKPWQAQLQIHVFHQEYSELKDRTLVDNLMAAQRMIITAVSSNVQLDGTVLKLMAVTGEFVNFDETEEDVFITNLITLNYEVRG